MLALPVLVACVPSTTGTGTPASSGAWQATGGHVDVAAHLGALTAGSIFQAWVFQPGLLDSAVVSAVGTYEVAGFFLTTGEQIAGIELESSLSQHIGYQRHAEATFGVAGRWHAFLVDEQVVITASLSQGISFATAVPRIEDVRWRNATHVLSHNSYEVTLADPVRPEIALVFRLHHRSGVWGLFGDVEEGSNLAMMGLRYRFGLD